MLNPLIRSIIAFALVMLIAQSFQLDIPYAFIQDHFSFDPETRAHNYTQVIISFVNGIHHTVDEWDKIASEIEFLFKLPVHPYYNPTSGSYRIDLTNAALAKIYKPDDFIVALNLANHLRGLLKRIGKKGRVVHIAHSGGAILTYLAAKYHLNEDEKSRIDVISFGGGHSITRKYFNRSYIMNYYTINDPIIFVDTRAAILKSKITVLNDLQNRPMEMMLHQKDEDINQFLLSQENIHLSPENAFFYHSDHQNSSFHLFEEIYDEKYNTSFVFMKGLANDSMADHQMLGPSYRLALKREAIRLRQRIQQTIATYHHEYDWIRLARKKIANMTNQHHFWANLFKRSTKTLNITAETSKPQHNHFFNWFNSIQRKSNEKSSDDSPSLSNKTAMYAPDQNESRHEALLVLDHQKINQNNTVISISNHSIAKSLFHRIRDALVHQLFHRKNSSNHTAVNQNDLHNQSGILNMTYEANSTSEPYSSDPALTNRTIKVNGKPSWMHSIQVMIKGWWNRSGYKIMNRTIVNGSDSGPTEGE